VKRIKVICTGHHWCEFMLVWPTPLMQVLTDDVDYQISFFLGGSGQRLSITMWLGVTRVCLPNSILFYPMASAVCVSVMNRQTDHTTVTSVAIAGITDAVFRDFALESYW